MRKNVKPPGYWTKERCIEDARLYETRNEWRVNSGSAYTIAGRNKWRDLCCAHMKIKGAGSGYWTKERCLKESLKFETRTSFRKKSKGAYAASVKHGCYEECCKHMKDLGSLYRRAVYAYEFSDNKVYVGLTCDIVRRKSQHITDRNSAVFKHIQETGSKYKFIKLTDILDVGSAKEKEFEFLKKYIDSGWKPLNRVKTGGTGGTALIWSYEECKKIALACKHKKELFVDYPGLYSAAKTHGWLKDICSHMTPPPKEYKWSIDDVKEEALKYKSRVEFKTNSPSAYHAAVRNKWLGEVCSNLVPKRGREPVWTLEKCKEVCKENNYLTRAEVRKLNPNLYSILNRRRWLDLLFPVPEELKRRLVWTYDECKAEAKRFAKRYHFKIGSSGAYQASIKNKWIDDFFD